MSDSTDKLGEALRRVEVEERAVESETWSEPNSGLPLEEMADITVGIVVRPADLYVKHGGVAALRSLNVAPNRLLDADTVHISEEGHEQHRKSSLLGDEVVVVRSGRPGDAAVIPLDGEPRNAIDLLIVRCREGLKPEYLSRYLNSSNARRQLLGRSAGTAQQHLNASQLKQVLVPILPLETQEELLIKFHSIDEVREGIRRSIDDLRILASALREHFMKGAGDVY
jgi:type I restriction enzyme S subunit